MLFTSFISSLKHTNADIVTFSAGWDPDNDKIEPDNQ